MKIENAIDEWYPSNFSKPCYYEFETNPFDWNCKQVDRLGPNYHERTALVARAEARTLIAQLERQFQQPDGVYYMTKSNPYEFGYYYSVRLVYDDNDENHRQFVNELKANFPKNWDKKSRKMLVRLMIMRYRERFLDN
jgi:hypothetical protein